MNNTEPPNMVEHAHTYAKHGWRTLPIAPGTKYPKMASWQHAATTNTTTHNAWWNGLYRGHGIGIATGIESGIWVLDIDMHDTDGHAALQQLQTEHGQLPATPTCLTGGGGKHLYYRYPVLADGDRIGTTSALADGIDVRGDGGQCVTAPTTHTNGTPYQWAAGLHPDETPIADAPQWLIQLVTIHPGKPPPPPVNTLPATTPRHTPVNAVTDSIADHVRQTHRWSEILTLDGWQPSARSANRGAQHWTRPGKTDGTTSALLNNNGDGPLVIFSTSSTIGALHLPWAQTANGTWSYSLFDYLTATRHGGDRRTAARAYRAELTAEQHQTHTYTTATIAHATLDGTPPNPNVDDLTNQLIDWEQFYNAEPETTQWLLEPFLAAGRGHAIHAPGGTGKSLFALWAACQIATGGNGLTGEPTPPAHVLYIDYEQTTADLRERLDAMGYTTPDELHRLHYLMLPTVDPADHATGGTQIVNTANATNAAVIIIDTYGRAVAGDENEADTTRAFYRHTGARLKADGRAFVRLDHQGKNTEKGARGSSAKNDDVDIVYALKTVDGGLMLTTTKRRMAWVPEVLHITQPVGETLTYTTGPVSVPAGTGEVVQLLDQYGAADEISVRAAIELLRNNGQGRAKTKVEAAIRTRKQRARNNPFGVVNGPGSPGNETGENNNTTGGGQKTKTPSEQVRGHSGVAGVTDATVMTPYVPPLKGGHRVTATPTPNPLTIFDPQP